MIASLQAQWIRPFLPSGALLAWLTPIAALYALAAAALAAWLRVRRSVRTPYTRKVFHFLIFTLAGVVQLLWGLPGVVIYGSVVSLRVLFAIWRGDDDPFYEALARPSDAPHRTLYIVIPLITTAAGGVLSNLLFSPFGYVGYLVCGWGDAVGEPVGTRWGRHRYRVLSITGTPATRSVEGSAAVFLVSSLAASLALIAAGFAPGTAALVGLAAGLGACLVEAISNHGLDNLTTQLVAAGIAFWLAG